MFKKLFAVLVISVFMTASVVGAEWVGDNDYYVPQYGFGSTMGVIDNSVQAQGQVQGVITNGAVEYGDLKASADVIAFQAGGQIQQADVFVPTVEGQIYQYGYYDYRDGSYDYTYWYDYYNDGWYYNYNYEYDYDNYTYQYGYYDGYLYSKLPESVIKSQVQVLGGQTIQMNFAGGTITMIQNPSVQMSTLEVTQTSNQNNDNGNGCYDGPR